MGKDVESQIKEVVDHYQKYDADWIMKPGERKKVVEYLLYGYSATVICDAGQAARLKSERQARKEDENRKRNMERKDMASRHLAGFRYVNEARKSMDKGSGGGMVE